MGTAAAILSYVGKPFTILAEGKRERVFGWQGLHGVHYPELGLRVFGYCDIPDLDLFPERYPELRDLRFVAGHEVKLLHFGTWLLSWGVRLGLAKSLSPYADRLLKLSFLFDPLGSDKSGFHMVLEGKGTDGRAKTVRIFMTRGRCMGRISPAFPQSSLPGALPRASRLLPEHGPASTSSTCRNISMH
ncbi:hypothetical protein LZ016_09860 [Sphingomonas sp. SM33]|uniref:Uncharacterized protein n=1 Tax=Sphingomonas telluris TaxID=2907998 RepID=A0ABS9VN54_9SPHN|nr:hypothetical protein [Sphingomonas telluris]MCH8616403.1 hypothetical protein [Sphingomonas telluris]